MRTGRPQGSPLPVRTQSRGAFLVPAERGDFGDPGLRRAAPVLHFRHELVALAQGSDPHHVGRLRSVTRRGRVDRRAALRAERLRARIAAFRRRLHVDRRLARKQPEARPGNRNVGAEGGPRAGLAVGAMADRRLVRIGLALERDIAAVAAAVDLQHVESSLVASAVDLKFLSDVRQVPYRNFKSKTALETIYLLVLLLIPKFA